jgi:hypothetical protein
VAVETVLCPACMTGILDGRDASCPRCQTPVSRSSRPLPLLERELAARIEAKTASGFRRRRRAAKVARRIAALPPTLFEPGLGAPIDHERVVGPKEPPTIVDLPAEAVYRVRSSSAPVGTTGGVIDLGPVERVAPAPVEDVPPAVDVTAPAPPPAPADAPATCRPPRARKRRRPAPPAPVRAPGSRPAPVSEATAAREPKPATASKTEPEAAPGQRPVKESKPAPAPNRRTERKPARDPGPVSKPAAADRNPGPDRKPKPKATAGSRQKPVSASKSTAVSKPKPVLDTESAEESPLATVTRIGTQGTNPVWRDRVFNSARRTQPTVTWPRPRPQAGNRADRPADRWGGAAG